VLSFVVSVHLALLVDLAEVLGAVSAGGSKNWACLAATYLSSFFWALAWRFLGVPVKLSPFFSFSVSMAVDVSMIV